jgi:hypothetical protein
MPAGWVSKKIKELMGEEETSFCEFIMSQVGAGGGDPKAVILGAQTGAKGRALERPARQALGACMNQGSSWCLRMALRSTSRAGVCGSEPCLSHFGQRLCAARRHLAIPTRPAEALRPWPAGRPTHALSWQVSAHATAASMLESLKDVLDEDTPSFTTKLYQVLIYESEKLAMTGA